MKSSLLTKLSKRENEILPTWGNFRVVGSSVLPGGYSRLEIFAPSIAERAKPGQFVMLSPSDEDRGTMVLPRPMAIHRTHDGKGTIEVVFKIVGSGTANLSKATNGKELYVFGPLGNGFQISENIDQILLVGRGIGICSITSVAQEAQKMQIPVTALISGKSENECVGVDDFQEFGARSFVVSDDTSTSEVDRVERFLKGAFPSDTPDVIMVCGSNRLIEMAARLGNTWGVPVQASLEAHMACGIGYCHGCSLGSVSVSVTNEESPLVCVDGPVFGVSLASEISAMERPVE